MKRLLAGIFAVVLLVPTAASATDLSFSGPDIAQLLQAVEASEKSPDIHLTINLAAAKDMPAYDAVVHYAGLNPGGKPNEATIMVAQPMDPKSDAFATGFTTALRLACMDTGFAGPKWKAIYDMAAAADAKLNPSEPDRYYNRHLITSAIQTEIDKVEKASASPSPAP
jgi:hypothetical protein